MSTKALKLFGTKHPPFSELTLHRMRVQDRKRQVILQTDDLEWEEPHRQLYVENYRGTHPKRTLGSIIKHYFEQLLP